MKNVYLLFAVFTVIGLGFSACKKDDKPLTAFIVGDWHVTEIKYAYVTNGVEHITWDTKPDAADITTHFTFYDNGTGLQHPVDPAYRNLVTFNYTLSNELLTVKPLFFLVYRDKFTVTKVSDSEMTLSVKSKATNGSEDLIVLSFSK